MSPSRRSSTLTALVAAAGFCAAAATGCGDVDNNHLSEGELPYASELISFEPGEGAGFGQDDMPDVVLGPPAGRGTNAGSLDVVSLGDGGEIVVGFGDREIVDGPGDDFVVFENPFWPAGNADEVYAELGEVSVSEDGENWEVFECDYAVDDPPPYEGCAGWSPTLEYDAKELLPLDPELSGGDAFDLSDVGVERARYVRIRDVWGTGAEPSQGFDLDAVGFIEH